MDTGTIIICISPSLIQQALTIIIKHLHISSHIINGISLWFRPTIRLVNTQLIYLILLLRNNCTLIPELLKLSIHGNLIMV